MTDILRNKSDEPNDVIRNWIKNRDTIEFLVLWESLYNLNSKPVEFDRFRNQEGLNQEMIKKICLTNNFIDIKNMII